MSNSNIDLAAIAASKAAYLKGSWVSAGYKVWKAFDPNLGTEIFVQVRENSSYAVKNRIRDVSKTRNTIKIVMGTGFDRRYGDLSSSKKVMEVVYLGEDFQKRDARRAQITKRMVTRFGIDPFSYEA